MRHSRYAHALQTRAIGESTMHKKKVAISIGDINGIGIEIALRAHEHIIEFATPIYCVHTEILSQAYEILTLPHLPSHLLAPPICENLPTLTPGAIDPQSGAYSYASFAHACDLVDSQKCHAVVTLPIHKLAWQQAHIPYIGHTDALKARYHQEAIMMLGCEAMFVALFSDHIALKDVSAHIRTPAIKDFLLHLARALPDMEECAVLGLNPHCGDGGLMGEEDTHINQAIALANDTLHKELFIGALPPDSAFSPHNRARFRFYVSMYHDVGLAPLKALYFEESINVTLNLPILRTSVDHGVAFDKAYKSQNLSLQSYINAIRYAVTHNG